MNRQAITRREAFDRWARQQCWRPDNREGPLDGMLIALIVVIAICGFVLLRCGGPA